MSMYTTGSSELGCIITGENMDYFVKKYIQQNPEEFREFEPTLVERIPLIRKAASALKSLNVKKDSSVRKQTDLYDGPEDAMWEWLDTNESFTSCGRDGKFYARMMRDDPYYPHVYFMAISDASVYDSVDLDIIFVNADKSPVTKTVLRGDFYKDKAELVDEFKAKIGSYLPADFDWEANIGDLDYAICC